MTIPPHAAEETEREDEFRYSLLGTCQRYVVSYPFAAHKERLEQSFQNQPDEAPFTDEQNKFPAAEATAAAQLYPAQVLAATQAGILIPGRGSAAAARGRLEKQLSDLIFPPKSNPANRSLAEHLWDHRDDLFIRLTRPCA